VGARGKDRFAASFETLYPDAGIELTERHRELCRARDLDPENEVGKHRAWARSHGRKCLDWGEDLELWIRNTRPGKRAAAGGSGQETPAERRTREQLERVATLEAEERAEAERKAANE